MTGGGIIDLDVLFLIFYAGGDGNANHVFRALVLLPPSSDAPIDESDAADDAIVPLRVRRHAGRKCAAHVLGGPALHPFRNPTGIPRGVHLAGPTRNRFYDGSPYERQKWRGF